MLEKKFYRCNTCGNIFGAIHDSGVTPSCCGQRMELLEANTTDAATEKHVPVITREGTKVTVKVGSVAHPMLAEHFIQWVVLTQGNATERAALKPGDAPEAVFTVSDAAAPVRAYEYCNLHGLWTAEG
ncbi:MAG: desulfoferrodoxin [Acidobacteriota bacterium]|jgi:superoxide reductase|nr:desulfoferrodoxin [Acidobacteriota bacterium]